jgi:hypothetical protein
MRYCQIRDQQPRHVSSRLIVDAVAKRTEPLHKPGAKLIARQLENLIRTSRRSGLRPIPAFRIGADQCADHQIVAIARPDSAAAPVQMVDQKAFGRSWQAKARKAVDSYME